MKHPLKKNQQGLAIVEFTICATVYFMVLFAVIEMGRLMFTLNVLDEVTRRGARLAAVCPVTENTEVINKAILNGKIISGLGPEHVSINYFQSDLTQIFNPVAEFSDIAYVRVQIEDFNLRLLIPFIDFDISSPQFSTTVLAESLGVSPPGAVIGAGITCSV